MADLRKDCCKDPANLGAPLQERLDLEVRICQVCGCRHFELTVDPGRIGLRGAQVGG